MYFLVFFLLWPFLEIWLFVALADKIGLLDTFFLAIAMIVAGGLLVQAQGIKTLNAIQTAMQQGELPVFALFDQICLFLAGALFILPGFLSDIFAIMLLLPPFRRIIYGATGHFFTGEPFTIRGFGRRPAQEEVIEADFIVVEEDDASKDAAKNEQDRPLLP